MALPSSSTDVVNLALDLLKEKSVSDIAAPTTAVESIAARWYDLVRAQLISSRSWNFARRSGLFLRDGTPEDSVYADSYALPNAYLKLLALFDPTHPLTQYDYSIEGGHLLIDNNGGESVKAWFLSNITDVSSFPPYFTSYLAAQLAYTISYKITAKNALKGDLKLVLDEAKQIALAANGQERPPRKFETSKLVNVGRNPASQQFVAGDFSFDFEPN